MYLASSLLILSLVAQSAPSTTPEGKAKAQVLLKEGAGLYEKGDLAAAFEKFEKAYESYASPKLLFNIGQTARGLGRLVDSMNAFERFLADDTDAPADMRTEALNSVAEMQSKLGRLLIRCETQGSEISLDGKSLGTSPVTRPVWAMPGSHQVTAQHPSAAPAIEQVDVVAAAVQTVTLVLKPLPKSEPVVAETETSAISPPSWVKAKPSAESVLSVPQPSSSNGWLLGRKWTWVAAGSAVLFAGGAAMLGNAMQSKFDSLDRSCGKGSATADGNYQGCSSGDIDQVILRRNLANLFWGLSGAAVVTAGVLYFIEGRDVLVAPMAGEAFGLVARTSY
jgi:hypothetical protein